MPAPHHSVFLQAGCPSCHPTNSIKALKAPTIHPHFINSISASIIQSDGLVAEWLACSTQAQKGLGSNRSRDDVPYTISVCNRPTSYPSLHPYAGSLNRVPAYLAEVKTGMSALLCDPITYVSSHSGAAVSLTVIAGYFTLICFKTLACIGHDHSPLVPLCITVFAAHTYYARSSLSYHELFVATSRVKGRSHYM